MVNIRANRLEGRINRHVHPHSNHFLYIIQGQVAFPVDDQRRVVAAGDFVMISRGVSHAMQRIGEAAALFLDVAAPPDVGDVIWQESAMPSLALTSGPSYRRVRPSAAAREGTVWTRSSISKSSIPINAAPWPRWPRLVSISK